jgi:hypothetical protein
MYHQPGVVNLVLYENMVIHNTGDEIECSGSEAFEVPSAVVLEIRLMFVLEVLLVI